MNERNDINNKHHARRSSGAASALSKGSAGYDAGSDIYVTSGAYRAPSEFRYNRLLFR